MTIESAWRRPTRRILVIRLGALGDLIHASAAWDEVQRQCPDAEIHLLTSPIYLKLADLMPNVQKIWTWDKRAGLGTLFSLAIKLRKERYEAVVNLHPSFKTWLLTQLALPKKQAWYRKQKFWKKGLALRQLERRHATVDFYEPFRRLLKLPYAQKLTPVLRLPDGIERPKSSQERWIGLIPGVGAKRGNRAWLPESYRELIQSLLSVSGTRILVFGGPDEQQLADAILEGFPSACVENHCGVHDVLGTARLMARCDMVIGGDTGPLHLAAAVGARLISIYGPTSLNRTGPLGVQLGVSLVPPDELKCWPCERANCPLSGDAHLACMRRISVEQVLNACSQLMTPV
ncbi:MAG TPA: glycosyltransferase family 9 protein [Oculatellaceae cyanobacterium]|jgi:lipopolysaccharide heptosyltransferase II